MSRNKFKRKGKSKFLMLDGYIMRCAAWQSLSAVDRASYLEVKWRYDGLNNGRIGLGCRELADAIHVSKDTASRSLQNLVATGFLAAGKASGFNVKNRTATEWRLTEYKSDVTGQLPTKDYMRWEPTEKTQSDDRDVQSDHRDTTPAKTARKAPHSPMTRTVKPISGGAQSDDRDTYSTTMEGAANAA